VLHAGSDGDRSFESVLFGRSSNSTELRIRLAAEADAEQAAAIYAPVVRETCISFELEPPDATEMRRRILATLERYPWLVCEQGGELSGYAYASEHRSRPAYRWSADVSAYVAPRRHRSGVGRALYGALFELLRLQGLYGAFAGITLPNAASVGLHEALGFQPVGVYRAVGFKLGAWHDVGWWRLALREPVGEPAEPLGYPAVRERLEARSGTHLRL
jgi:L-amino acid N-acyltransferase YncA